MSLVILFLWAVGLGGLDTFDELVELTLVVVLKLTGRTHLFDTTVVHNYDLVRVHDCLQSVSDCEDSAALELGADQLLNFLLSLDVNVGSSFVKQNDFVLAKNSSTYSQK